MPQTTSFEYRSFSLPEVMQLVRDLKNGKILYMCKSGYLIGVFNPIPHQFGTLAFKANHKTLLSHSLLLLQVRKFAASESSCLC
jgi:hypothetical protein